MHNQDQGNSIREVFPTNQLTAIQAMADVRHLAIEDTDAIINAFYENLYTEDGGAKPLLEDMTAAEKQKFAQKEAELNREPEAQQLDRVVEKQTDVLAANGVDGHKGVAGMNGETTAAT